MLEQALGVAVLAGIQSRAEILRRQSLQIEGEAAAIERGHQFQVQPDVLAPVLQSPAQLSAQRASDLSARADQDQIDATGAALQECGRPKRPRFQRMRLRNRCERLLPGLDCGKTHRDAHGLGRRDGQRAGAGAGIDTFIAI